MAAFISLQSVMPEWSKRVHVKRGPFTSQRGASTITLAARPLPVTLTSFNAKPINGVKLDWIGEICVTLPSRGWRLCRPRASCESCDDGRTVRRLQHARGQYYRPRLIPDSMI
jgi:hypothetical protein